MTRIKQGESALDDRYRDGYRRKPESASVGKTGEKLAVEVWPREIWPDVTTRRRRKERHRRSNEP